MKKKVPDDGIRSLVLVSIIHTEADMGSLAESLRDASVHRIGWDGRTRKQRLIEKFWSAVEQAVEALELDYGRVRLYQDGLPICSAEKEIVMELAKSGSRNHKLLLSLVEKGGILMGTESPELLKKEYELAKRMLSARTKPTDVYDKKQSEELLKERDAFIANRINETLLPGETGILFVGMLHRLEGLLQKDIKQFFLVKGL